MYYAVILLVMLVLPAVSVVVEFVLTREAAGWLPLIGPGVGVWGVGLRLRVAGLRQVIRPGLTAELLGVKDASANVLVRELGFGNLAIGATGALTLTLPNWTLAAAICGGLFYGFAGLQHVFSKHRTSEENWAMVSDIAIAVVLAVFVGLSLPR